ncbi:hypothetical protein [Vibrio cincinnatiensis]|uniref:hypothetical protein n=1 Tax=Vibrio cincinnatiensis TaxID=675 RepID=UPI001EE0A3D2|nr:hypothetical protein [Vibrio cincinnatiensis]EGR0725333.1 hypothetical protein [Vibrio cholerae]HCG6118637.1 hypothetical protein [Vibrio parahaemolyticus]EGR3933910.1 hypothetical protein [Vibrio cholerae]EGR3934431.1 hypothetical protein [Vibrio cholerae]MCG3721463.1 hypothetical protein [Vibrio cincinnatiensis]
MKNVMIKFKNSRKSSYVIEKDILKDKSEQFQLKHSNISDEEALRRANGLHSEHNEKPVYRVTDNYSESPKVKKENRVPGLYGCNRYKSKKPEVFNIL